MKGFSYIFFRLIYQVMEMTSMKMREKEPDSMLIFDIT